MSTAEMGTHTRIWVLLIVLSLSTTNLINFFIQAEKYSNLHSSTLSETNTNSHSSGSSSSSSSSNNNNNNNKNNKHNNNNHNHNNDNRYINSGDNNDSASKRSQNPNPSPNGIFVNGVPSNPTGSKQQQLSTASTKKKLEDFKEYDCPDHNPSCLKDKENFNAIKTLHDLIDDDRNGNVDQTESDEFLRVELQYTDGFERHFTFHGNDGFISVEDLWKSWKQSEVYNWTVDDVVDWLVHHVELPQYVTNFQTHKIDGSTLPRMAASHQYLSTIGVKNNVHKQKLSLKAMDVVLFGPPKKGHSYIKDLTLIASLIIAIGGCWFAYLQHKYSQAHVKKMMRDWESLQIAEESLKELQERLDKAQQEQNLNDRLKDVEGIEPDSDVKLLRKQSLDEISRGKIEEELKQVKANLRKAEKELESRQWSSAPADLQKWLQLTYEIELQHHNNKKLAAENQLREARDCCEKLKKKRNAFMGPLRIAHGNSIDEVDKRILNARASLEVVHQDLQERLGRWRAIERLCAFSVTKNSGLASLMQTMHQDKLTPGFPAKTPSSKDLQTYPKNLSSSLNRRSIDTISNHSGGSPISPESEVTFHLGESPPHSLCHEDVAPPPSYSSVNTVVPSGSGKVYSSSGYMPMTKSENLIRNRFDSLISSTSESSLTELDQRKQSESSLRMTGSSVLPLTVEEGCDSETESTESTEDKKKSRKKKVLGKIFRRNGDVKKKS
ncbi:stromal interaction molecule homolog isoform X2 [Octopus bimaculoides]|uniref:stromal interaction molecule homolog isoform X2 n=1 Tax=Octopus bimaculoides TaxID=37653 RepID=UPI0022DF653A|nr:stromal interaction molecule homolog isoform X2 [Octopus bimaculoides]